MGPPRLGNGARLLRGEQRVRRRGIAARLGG
jgi:hypothetical protein